MVNKEEYIDAKHLKSLSKPHKKDLSDDEKAFLYGEVEEKAPNQTDTDNKEEGSLFSFSSQESQEPAQPVGYKSPTQREDGEVIIIKDQKKLVRIKYTHTTPDGKSITFSVRVPAASVEVQSDGVSILISKDIEIRPPSLTPCTLEVGTQEQPIKEYNVIFAGATHTIGKYINIPFIIVE